MGKIAWIHQILVSNFLSAPPHNGEISHGIVYNMPLHTSRLWGSCGVCFCFAAMLETPKKGNVERFNGLFCTKMLMNNSQDFILFSLADADKFQRFSGSTIGTHESFIIESGKCRCTCVFLSALGANRRSLFIRFHYLVPSSLTAIAFIRSAGLKPK